MYIDTNPVLKIMRYHSLREREVVWNGYKNYLVFQMYSDDTSSFFSQSKSHILASILKRLALPQPQEQMLQSQEKTREMGQWIL